MQAVSIQPASSSRPVAESPTRIDRIAPTLLRLRRQRTFAFRGGWGDPQASGLLTDTITAEDPIESVELGWEPANSPRSWSRDITISRAVFTSPAAALLPEQCHAVVVERISPAAKPRGECCFCHRGMTRASYDVVDSPRAWRILDWSRCCLRPLTTVHGDPLRLANKRSRLLLPSLSLATPLWSSHGRFLLQSVIRIGASLGSRWGAILPPSLPPQCRFALPSPRLPRRTPPDLYFWTALLAKLSIGTRFGHSRTSDSHRCSTRQARCGFQFSITIQRLSFWRRLAMDLCLWRQHGRSTNTGPVVHYRCSLAATPNSCSDTASQLHRRLRSRSLEHSPKQPLLKTGYHSVGL